MFSVFVLLTQFLLPSMILLLANGRIYRKLKSLRFWGKPRQSTVSILTEIELLSLQNTAKEDNKSGIKGKRTLILLACVVILFILLWLPLNLLNVTLDLGLYSSLFRYIPQ